MSEVIELMEVPSGWKYIIDSHVEIWECEACQTQKIFSISTPLDVVTAHLSEHKEKECRRFKILAA